VQEGLLNKSVLDDSLSDFLLPDVHISYTLSKAENKDWNETWEQEGFDPIDVCHKVLIVDANQSEFLSSEAHGDSEFKDGKEGEAGNVSAEGTAYDVVVRIAARQAFGTGTHQTTQMIVSEMLGMDLKGKRVLDCGCGTGILSIVACKLWAAEACGYDIDQWSVDNTRDNAKLNQVDNLLALLGDASVLQRIEGQFDVVLANINRNILLHDMPAFRTKMKKGALLVLSGFYVADLPLLEDEAATLGLHLDHQQHKDDWCCAVFKANA
jgi:ribosomal protein L11 methyltransferase